MDTVQNNTEPQFANGMTKAEFEEAQFQLGKDISQHEAYQYVSWNRVLSTKFDEIKLLDFIDKRFIAVATDIANPTLKKESTMMDSLRSELRLLQSLQKILNSKKLNKRIAKSGVDKLKSK